MHFGRVCVCVCMSNRGSHIASNSIFMIKSVCKLLFVYAYSLILHN